MMAESNSRVKMMYTLLDSLLESRCRQYYNKSRQQHMDIISAGAPTSTDQNPTADSSSSNNSSSKTQARKIRQTPF
jgi:hypothetical protein